MMNEINLFGQSTSLLEVIAMLTGIAGVWLTMKESIWCFPIGIINVSLYAWLFISPGVRLYADALLQCIYIFLLFFGWINWSQKNKSSDKIHPVKIKSNDSRKLIIICLLSTIALALFLQKFTNASYPWLDSVLTCSSLAAQWMIAKKIIENWIVWILVDIIYLPLYIIKHLPLTAILYAVFLLLAFRGYAEWKKNLAFNET
jgi:nicotinamide mononucleotide transporter